MQELERHRHLPDADHLSVLVGTILLAFALAHFISLPVRQLSVQLPGIYLLINFGIQELVALLVALLTATGADWLLRDHPNRGKHLLVEHWLLPGLTAWAIGLPLLQLPLTPVWWIGFALGGILLILVLVAEYISIDPEDVRHPPAAAGLTAVSFALFLVLVAGLRFANTRLFLLLPALGLASGLVSLRTVHLRLNERWAFLEAGLVALVTIQMAAALHYLPVSPISFGLALLGPAYTLTNLLGSLAEGKPLRQAVWEPVVVLALIWGVTLLIH
jgi:Protein of unknown function (DUF5656)